MLFFHQKIFKTVISAGILVFWLLGAAAGSGFESREIGVVAVDRLNMRLGAGTGYAVVKVLKKDDQVRVLAHDRGWLQVFHESDVGYIADESRFVKLYTIHTVTDGKQSELEIAAARAREIQEEVRRHTEEIADYNRREKAIVKKLHKTDQTLNTVRQTLAAIESELGAVDATIAKKRGEIEAAEKQINKRSGYALKRLVALYKLHKLGEANLLASATSLQDLMRRRTGVEKILNYDQSVIGRLAGEKAHLRGLMTELTAEKNKKEKLNQKARATAAALEKEKKQREALLAEIKQKKTSRLATIKYLQDAAIKMDKTIDSLRRESDASREGHNNFSAYQGLLKMPVNGKVISKFGKYVEPQSGASNFRNGIEIQSGRGAPIRAIFSGKTIYSSWLKGYGNVIILAHGKHFHTVYAHAEELFRAKGDTVETGEVIATVGDTGSISGPSLYFEIRYQGNPVDPLEWINKS